MQHREKGNFVVNTPTNGVGPSKSSTEHPRLRRWNAVQSPIRRKRDAHIVRPHQTWKCRGTEQNIDGSADACPQHALPCTNHHHGGILCSARQRAADPERGHWRQSARGGGRGPDDLATGKPGRKPIHPQHLARLISQHATEDAIFTFVVGTPSICAPRYLKMNGRRRSTAGRAVVIPRQLRPSIESEELDTC